MAAYQGFIVESHKLMYEITKRAEISVIENS
jgi:hypothetical protein